MEISGNDCSLLELLEYYIRSQGEETGVQDMIPFDPEKYLENWKKFSRVIRSNDHGPALRDLLTDKQKHSYKLLMEGIKSYAQMSYVASISALLSIGRPRDNETDNDHEDGPSRLIRHGTIPDYDESIAALLKAEFTLYTNRKKLELTSTIWQALETARITATLQAYCQKIVWRCCYGSQDEGDNHTLPAHLRELLTDPPDSLEHGPPLRSCPWLDENPPREKYLNGWPHFLFDIECGRTVETQKLHVFPVYSAISHTWGRWRQHEKPPVEIEGVPWPIPQNGLFDVRKIPDSLRNCKLNTRYVWLDLVCIPQDGSKIAVQEIGRQADIFRNASRAVAWLHDVDNLSCLSAMFRFFALCLLQLSPMSPDIFIREIRRAAELMIIGQNQSGLLVLRDESDTEFGKLHPWFTSLWTLQELSLRPDMLLASSNWDTLSIDQTTRVPLNALTLVYIEYRRLQHSAPSSLSGDYFSMHISLREINHWIERSGLEVLFELNRIDILRLGDLRECEMRRSEAIMCALGTTTWFYQTDHKQHESNLVLGKYHPAFVEEVRLTMPGEFFGALLKFRIQAEGEFPLHEDAEVPVDWMKRHQWSSLLPFSKVQAYYLPASTVTSWLPAHDSLVSWEVRQSGQVHIPKVCILSSSAHEVPMQPIHLPCSIAGFHTKMPEGPKRDSRFEFELHQWTRTRPYEVHAVVTRCEMGHVTMEDGQVRSHGRVTGVFLRRIDKECFFNMGKFIAITREQLILPDVIEVD